MINSKKYFHLISNLIFWLYAILSLFHIKDENTLKNMFYEFMKINPYLLFKGHSLVIFNFSNIQKKSRSNVGSVFHYVKPNLIKIYYLEIMALVGMASKPLHVRRLQKALQEWVQNPGNYKLLIVIQCKSMTLLRKVFGNIK